MFKCAACDKFFSDFDPLTGPLYYTVENKEVKEIFCGPNCSLDWHEKAKNHLTQADENNIMNSSKQQ